MKKLLLILFSSFTFSQVGIGTTTPAAALDVTATNDGLLIPRVALSATNVATILTPTQSELVYNTFTSAAGAFQVTPGFYYWDAIATSWVRIMNNKDDRITTVNTIFDDLPNVNPNISPKVYCSGYWDKDDAGGGMFEWNATSTKDIDGGRYFASKVVTTGRWVRKLQDNVNVNHYGAIPIRNFFAGPNGNYGYGGVYYRDDIVLPWPIEPLSTKFATLAEAKAWYPRSVVALTDAIDAVAIQSTIEFNMEVFIPEGVYVCNKAIQLNRNRKIYGVGKHSVLRFVGCNGFVPHQSVSNNTTDNTYIYMENISVSDLGLYGDSPGVYAQSAPADNFDDNRCAINFPDIQGSPEAESNETPILYNLKLSNLYVGSWAGHGIKILNQFTSTIDKIVMDAVGGHGIYIQGGNTTMLTNCYVQRCGVGYASYRILSGGSLYACNGNDADNTWGMFGQDPAFGDDVNACGAFNLTGCNIEGMKIGIELRGNAGTLTMQSCSIQSKPDATEPYFIWDRSYKSAITIIDCEFYSINSVAPVTSIKATNGAGGKYLILGETSGINPKVLYANPVTNANIYGVGIYPRIPVVTTNVPDAYVERATAFNTVSAKSIYLGNNSDDTVISNVQILTGNGVPNIAAPVGSFYLRKDGGAGTTMYVKESGTGTAGWVPK